MENKKVKSMEGYTAKGAFDYLEDIKAEFKKVSWTSREELQVYTKVVVGATFVFGMSVYFAKSEGNAL